MSMLDVKVSTLNATREDFDRSVDLLRRMDARSNWSTVGFDPQEMPPNFGAEDLTAEEYTEYLQALCIFIEKLPEYFPPGNLPLFLYRRYNLIENTPRHLETYILYKYFENYQESDIDVLCFVTSNPGQLNKDLSRLSGFISSSDFIKAFVVNYANEMDFDGAFPNIISYIEEYNGCFDRFPFCLGSCKVFGERVKFIYPRYTVRNGTLFANKEYSLEEYLDKCPDMKVVYKKEEEQYNAISDHKQRLEDETREAEALKQKIRRLRSQISANLDQIEANKRKFFGKKKALEQNIILEQQNKELEKVCLGYTQKLGTQEAELEKIQSLLDQDNHVARALQAAKRLNGFVFGSRLQTIQSYMEEISDGVPVEEKDRVTLAMYKEGGDTGCVFMLEGKFFGLDPSNTIEFLEKAADFIPRVTRGTPYILKKDMPKEDALKWKKAFEDLGAVMVIV